MKIARKCVDCGKQFEPPYSGIIRCDECEHAAHVRSMALPERQPLAIWITWRSRACRSDVARTSRTRPTSTSESWRSKRSFARAGEKPAARKKLTPEIIEGRIQEIERKWHGWRDELRAREAKVTG